MRRLYVGGYFFCWMAASALLAYVPLAIGWERAGLSRRLGIDDGAVALVLPVGAALGAWAAARTRPAWNLRRFFLVAGSLLIIAGAWFTRSFLAASARATGSGPFAGFGASGCSGPWRSFPAPIADAAGVPGKSPATRGLAAVRVRIYFPL